MIKNLQAALPELGKIKSGIKGKEIISKDGNKFRPPQKLNHFIITTMERDESGDLVQDDALVSVLKKSNAARMDKEGNLTGIPIRLLYNDIELNFPTRYACYIGGKCTCSGDGEIGKTRDGREITCPCEKQDMAYQGKDKCKINGKLYCVVEGTTSVGACHVLRTTSFNTVQSIIGGLAFIQAAAGGMLAFLPLQLVLTPKTTVIPSSGAPVTVYVASIVYNGNIDELRQTALGMAQDKAKYLTQMDSIEASAKQLMLSVVESDEEQLEVNEEFYPDSIDVKSADIETKKSAEKVAGKKQKTVSKSKPKLKPKLKPETEVEKETLKESIESKQTAPDVATPLVEEKSDESVDLSKLKEPVPITADQKRMIVKLKKTLGIVDKKIWEGLVKEAVPGVASAVDMTTEEADVFIALLNSKDDIPF